MPESKDRDPYAPPPMHHDRSGAVLRVTLLAAMLGAAGLGYAWMSQQPQTALVPETVQEEQVADAGYTVSPETIPTGTTESLPPAPQAAAQAPARRSAPVERAPAPAPEPEPTPAPPPAVQPEPTTPTPLPPDLPPVGTVG